MNGSGIPAGGYFNRFNNLAVIVMNAVWL